MSNSLSPKKQLELFTPDARERALEILRNPFSLAILASIGIHGLLFVVLPMLPSAKPPEIDPKQTVGVVELSPTEQLRLPDAVNPQITFPPSSVQKQSKPSAKSPSKKASKPSLFDNSLYNFPLLAPPPPVTILPNIDLPPAFNDAPPKQVPISKPKKPITPSKPPTPPEAPSKPDAKAPSGSEAPTRSEKLTPDQVAALLDDAKARVNNRDLYAFNKSTAGQWSQEGLTKFIDTAQVVSKGNLKDGKDGWDKQKEITDQYPKEACPFEAQGNAVVGVIVNPKGEPEGKPELLMSSGYRGLDELAIDYVSKQKLEPNEQYRAAMFPFKFVYSKSVCAPTGDSKPSS